MLLGARAAGAVLGQHNVKGESVRNDVGMDVLLQVHMGNTSS